MICLHINQKVAESTHGLWFQLYCQKWKFSSSQAVTYTS